MIWDTTNIKIKYELVVPRHFPKIAIVTGILPSRDYYIKIVIARIKKTIAILKSSVNKLFPIECTDHEIDQTDCIAY